MNDADRPWDRWLAVGLSTFLFFLPLGSRAAESPPAAANDPYLWLEDINGAPAMKWVKEQDEQSGSVLKKDPRYSDYYQKLLALYDAPDRIPSGQLDHGYVYNFWQDATHARGLWRRAPLASYVTPNPAWEVLIDVDKLDEEEHTLWVWEGAECEPGGERCLVSLSGNGGDAVETREFDLGSRAFVKDGFRLPSAKSSATWVDQNTILFGTDFGPGSMTDSSYPRIVKIWRRGQQIADARTVYEGKKTEISSQGAVFSGPYGTVPLIVHAVSFFSAEYFYVLPGDRVLKLPLPLSAEVHGVTGGQLIVTLRKEWKTGTKVIPQGALLAFPVQEFVRKRTAVQPVVLFTPDSHSMVDQVSAGRDAVYASIYRDVTGSVHTFRRQPDGKWADSTLDLPQGGSTRVVSTDTHGAEALVSFESFLTPPTLYFTEGGQQVKPIKSLPERFDASQLTAEQHWATSSDGTQIPYFVVHAREASGPRPTILYGYGGFEIALTPSYLADVGKIWLTHGGTYVLANIRGGGEFGPRWHDAALLVNRQRAFDDFAAVAKDLESHGISTPAQLGIMGGSNGGLLVSTVMTQHPELLAAVVCQVPLIDMVRYVKIGAGASWEAEYGDPADAELGAVIRKYSPYQNVQSDKHYPPVLFVTSTSDDRVTPVHARKMAAKMEAQGHDVLFYESTEGGHGAAATHAEAAEMRALSYVFLSQKLRDKGSRDAIAAARQALQKEQRELTAQQWPAADSSDLQRVRQHVNLLLVTGQPDNALALLESVPNPGLDLQLTLAGLLIAQHDYPRARLLLDGLTPQYPQQARLRAMLYGWWTLRGDTTRVDAVLQERAAAGATELVDRFAAADLRMRELDYAGAYQRFLELQQSAVDPFDRARSLSGAGVALFHLERYEDALQVLQQALELAPSNAGTVAAIGDVLLRLGRLDEAVDALRFALQISPWNERAHQLLGAGYTRRTYTQLLAAFPDRFASDSGSAELERGDKALQARHVRAARRIYEKVAASHPAWTDVEVRLGSLEYAQGNFIPARDHYRRAIALCPEYGRAHEGLARALEALRLQSDIHHDQDEAALRMAAMPDIAQIDQYVINWRSLSPRHQKRLALSLAPWARYIPALHAGGGTLYVKPTYQILSRAPYESHLRDQRIEYDSRLWDDVRGEGGHHVVVSTEDIETRISSTGYDTVLHEVSHQVHAILSHEWAGKIEALYAEAVRRQATSGDAFLSQYAGSSVWEYFAEGANSLNNHRRDPYDMREVVFERLQQRDPALMELAREIMFDADVRQSLPLQPGLQVAGG